MLYIDIYICKHLKNMLYIDRHIFYKKMFNFFYNESSRKMKNILNNSLFFQCMQKSLFHY